MSIRITPIICLSMCTMLMIFNDVELAAQQTPFRFVQRADVGREINVLPGQINSVRQLQGVCDAQCQQRLAESFGSLSGDEQLAFSSLDQSQQQQIVENEAADVRETVEMDMLDQVLSDDQMTRFQQLWTQFLGLDSLTSGQSSRFLGMSDNQTNQIQELQTAGSDLFNQCNQNSNLSSAQQEFTINNIQNVLIDQSVNILNDAQLEIFINLCGEPCQFDPEETAPDADPDADGTNGNEDNMNEMTGDQPADDSNVGPGNVDEDQTTPQSPGGSSTRTANLSRPTPTSQTRRAAQPVRRGVQPGQRSSRSTQTRSTRTPTRPQANGSSSRQRTRPPASRNRNRSQNRNR